RRGRHQRHALPEDLSGDFPVTLSNDDHVFHGAATHPALILTRSHALACDRVEGWPQAPNLSPSFETRCSRQGAPATLLRMRSECLSLSQDDELRLRFVPQSRS